MTMRLLVRRSERAARRGQVVGQGVGRQRLLVVSATLVLSCAVVSAPPFGPGAGGGDSNGMLDASAAMPACARSSAALSGLVNGNTLSLGNGTTVTPCVPNAPIHMRLGYSDSDTGSATGSSTAFTTDGITFPDGKFTRQYTSCGAFQRNDSTIARPTILKLADGSQTAGPSNVSTSSRWGAFGTCPFDRTLYQDNGWSTAFEENDNAMLVHMRLKNLEISRNSYMTVVPQSSVASPTTNGTGEYKLTFVPSNQSSAGWNVGDSCVFTDLWLRADTHIKVNVFGISTTVGALAGDDSLWGSILASIASLDNIPGLELDAWVYYMNTNKASSCTGSPTTLNLPDTVIQVSP
ncbi:MULTISPECIES: hypothetical protein [unclassified Nocardioides]|uniref:hypothetical protein n=1 Tax=unclassified Nocardioides TaxID=2615069 RepID=UPI0012E3BD9F|nr:MULTISPECIES: hypothetical protein [unclassified Nocardioides]